MPENESSIIDGCRALVSTCAGLKRNEAALVISDSGTRDLGACLEQQAKKKTSDVQHLVLPTAQIHGQEPSERVARAMLATDVIFCMTTMSLAHTKARFNATENGSRFLSLPDYSSEVLGSPALKVDFRKLSRHSKLIADLFTAGRQIIFSARAGSRLEFEIIGRTGNPAPGWCEGPGSLASPPNAETNVAIVEGSARGVLVVDGSIPCLEMGRLAEPVALTVEEGKVVSIDGPNADVLRNLFDSIDDENARMVAEFGVGLNPAARLSGSMLEDEGCLGTVHFGIGANATIGGKNGVPFHLDHIIRHPTFQLDDTYVMEDGEFRQEYSNERN